MPSTSRLGQIGAPARNTERPACDRCRGQKLRCVWPSSSASTCNRCTRAKVVCIASTNKPKGRPRTVNLDKQVSLNKESVISAAESRADANNDARMSQRFDQTPITSPNFTSSSILHDITTSDTPRDTTWDDMSTPLPGDYSLPVSNSDQELHSVQESWGSSSTPMSSTGTGPSAPSLASFEPTTRVYMADSSFSLPSSRKNDPELISNLCKIQMSLSRQMGNSNVISDEGARGIEELLSGFTSAPGPANLCPLPSTSMDCSYPSMGGSIRDRLRSAGIEMGELLALTSRLDRLLNPSENGSRSSVTSPSTSPVGIRYTSQGQEQHSPAVMYLALSCYSRLQQIFMRTIGILQQAQREPSGNSTEAAVRVMPCLVVDGYAMPVDASLELRITQQLCERILEHVNGKLGRSSG